MRGKKGTSCYLLLPLFSVTLIDISISLGVRKLKIVIKNLMYNIELKVTLGVTIESFSKTIDLSTICLSVN